MIEPRNDFKLKYELMPNGEQQQRQMRHFAGSRRFVFSKALNVAEGTLSKGRRSSITLACASNSPQWRNGTALPSGRLRSWPRGRHTQQQTLKI